MSKKGKIRDMFKKKDQLEKYPTLEYSTPRRVNATPMGELSANNLSIENAFPIEAKEGEKPSNREGFWVKEQIGVAKREYWLPKEAFDPFHIRTKQYTVGEVMLMLLQGQILRREYWPQNQFIMFRDSVDLDNELKQIKATKENPAFAKMENFIAKVTIHADPIKKDKFNIHIEPWNCVQNDLFAKDWMTVKIDFNNIEGKKK